MKYACPWIAPLLTALAVALPLHAQTAKDPGTPALTDATRQLPAQEGLEQALAQAKPLPLESLMDGPQTVLDKTYYWFLNPDGKTWDILFLYNPGYFGPHEPVVLDTGTGELKRFPPITGFSFHLVSQANVDGVRYFKTLTHGRRGDGRKLGWGVWSYDPATNDLKLAGRPLGPDVAGSEGGKWTLGEDDLIYGFDETTDGKQMVAWRFNPRTMESEVHPFAPTHKYTYWLYSAITLDGDWAYLEVGNRPCRVWAFNFKTHEHRMLVETGDHVIGDTRTLGIGQVALASSPDKPIGFKVIKREPDKQTDEMMVSSYWLKDGVITPVTDEKISPWSDEPVTALRRRRPRPLPRPIVHRTTPDAQTGEVTLTWRDPGSPDDAPWKEARFNVKRYNRPIRRLAPLDNHRLFALSESYGQAVVYDLKNNQRIALGDSSLSTYSMTSQGSKVYMSGYPSTQIWTYDDTKPWTRNDVMDISADPAKPLLDEGAAMNPANNVTLGRKYHIHMPFGGTLVGADGKIYTSGIIIRIGDGGALVWWDPATGEQNGLLEPFTAYRTYWMAGVPDAKADNAYIVLPTKPSRDDKDPNHTPDRGRLFVFDVAQQKITHLIDPPDDMRALGPIAPAGPHRAIGMGSGDTPKLYALDVRTGRFLWTRPVPVAPVTRFAAVRRQAGTMLYNAPDGQVWSIWNNTLVVINPDDGGVTVLGTIPNGTTGDIVFMDGQVYLAGASELRRVMKNPPATPSENNNARDDEAAPVAGDDRVQ